MQYAQIYVDRKMAKPKKLTYAIPPEILPYIAIGSLVDISVRGRLNRGIIANFTTSSPNTDKIVPITKLRSTGSVITLGQLKLYQSIAENTLSSLEDVLFYFLPPKIKLAKCSLNFKSGMRKTGQARYIYGNLHDRFTRYQKLIKSFKGSLLFVFPDQNILDQFKLFIHDPSLTIFSGKDHPSRRWEIWQQIQSKQSLVATTRIGVGFIPKPPSITIIDEPMSPGFKEDRRPKFTIDEIIPVLIQYGLRVVIGSNYPSVHDKYLYKITSRVDLPPTQLTIGKPDSIEEILPKIESLSSILIALPQKGEYGLVICRDCRTILNCPNCTKPIRQIDKNILSCSNCHKTYTGFPNCSNCQAINFTGYSIGTQALERKIKAIYPNRHIIRIDKNNPLKQNISNNAILISTQQIFSYPIERVEKVFCLGFDPFLDIPKFDQEENILSSLIKFLNLGKTGEIITKRPEHRIYHALASNDISGLQNLLVKERGINLPPATRFVDIIFTKEFDNKIKLRLDRFSKIPIQPTQHPKGQLIRLCIPRGLWKEFNQFSKDSLSGTILNPDPTN